MTDCEWTDDGRYLSDRSTLVFLASSQPALAASQLASLRQALAKAGGELVLAGNGEYHVKYGSRIATRWHLLQLMEEHGFKLDRIYTLTG